MLEVEAEKLSKAHDRYSRLNFEEAATRFEKPGLAFRMRVLRRMLMHPHPDVKPVYVAAPDGVSLDEVFMRGVQRIRPANDKGEELRDVIIWLWVVQYSSSCDQHVAFVSNDKAYWSDADIHPQIKQDAELSKGKITLHRSIGDFITAHAPAKRPATPDWVGKPLLEERVVHELGRLAWGTVAQLVIEAIEFSDGNVFEIDPETAFAELRFHLVVSFEYKPTAAFGGWSDMRSLRSLKYVSQMPAGIEPAEEPPVEIRANAQARVSVRVKREAVAETSVTAVDVDQSQLLTSFLKIKFKQQTQ